MKALRPVIVLVFALASVASFVWFVASIGALAPSPDKYPGAEVAKAQK